jgi:hypothetical protein
VTDTRKGTVASVPLLLPAKLMRGDVATTLVT